MLKNFIAGLSFIAASHAYADNFTILSGFPPGGGNYIVSRVVSESANALGYKNIVEVKAGAGGIVGMNDCVSRVNEQNLICITSQAQYVYSVIPSLDDVRKFDPKTLTYVKMIGFSPNVLITSAKNKKNLNEVVSDLNHNEKVSFGAGALGLRVLSSMIIKETQTKNAVVVDYKGVGPVVTDVMGGHVDYAFVPYTTVVAQVKSGLIRIVANAGLDTPELKEYPKLGKLFPSLGENTTMFGFVMGPNADKNTVDYFNTIFTKVLDDKNVREKLEKMGIFPMPSSSTPLDFRNFAHQERERFLNQIKLVPVQ